MQVKQAASQQAGRQSGVKILIMKVRALPGPLPKTLKPVTRRPLVPCRCPFTTVFPHKMAQIWLWPFGAAPSRRSASKLPTKTVHERGDGDAAAVQTSTHISAVCINGHMRVGWIESGDWDGLEGSQHRGSERGECVGGDSWGAHTEGHAPSVAFQSTNGH